MSPATITLIFLAFAIVMFVTEKIPLGLTSMIVCVGLCVTRVLDVKTAFAGFIDSNVILFVAMFIVGGAFFETGMANEIGGIVTKFAKTERSLIVAIMVIVGLMSGVLSNTGTAAVLIPVVIGIAAKSGFKRSRLLMPLVFAAAMGGNLSLIGAPGNMIAQSALEPLGLKFGFFEYAIVGLPILICGIIFYATIGFNLLPNHDTTDNGDSVFDNQRDFSKVPQWKKTLSLVILILTLAAMVFEDQIGIKLCVSGGVGAIQEILLAAGDLRRQPRIDAAHAERPEEVAIWIDEPPLAIDLLGAEKAGGGELRAVGPATEAVGVGDGAVGVGVEPRLLLGAGGDEIGVIVYLPRPVVVHELPVAVNEREERCGGNHLRLAGRVGGFDAQDGKGRVNRGCPPHLDSPHFPEIGQLLQRRGLPQHSSERHGFVGGVWGVVERDGDCADGVWRDA